MPSKKQYSKQLFNLNTWTRKRWLVVIGVTAGVMVAITGVVTWLDFQKIEGARRDIEAVVAEMNADPETAGWKVEPGCNSVHSLSVLPEDKYCFVTAKKTLTAENRDEAYGEVERYNNLLRNEQQYFLFSGTTPTSDSVYESTSGIQTTGLRNKSSNLSCGLIFKIEEKRLEVELSCSKDTIWAYYNRVDK